MPLIRGKQIEANGVTSTQAATGGSTDNVAAGDTAAEGSSSNLAREDHAHAVDVTDGTISTVNAGDSAVEGSGTGLSRRDHQHDVATAAAGAIQVGDSAAEGAATSLARSDHTHSLASPAAPADVTKAAAAAGSATAAARADHKHDITTATASELAEANAEGTATTLARSDHTHDHGNRSGGTLHAAATGAVNGFMSSTDKTKLDALQDAAGIDAKESCYVRAQGNLSLTGEQTIDGELTSTSRVLVDQQSTASQDGIYVTAAGAWSRSADMPTGTEARGVRVWIEEGTTDGARLYSCSNIEGADIVGTDGLTFGLIGAGSPRAAGDGMVLNGNDLDVVANADGSIIVNTNDVQVGILATDAQHGNLGGGALHADVVAAGADGFMTGADKTKLDGITAGADPNDTENQESVTTQVITGTDTAITDTLNATPISNASVVLYLNGVMQEQGATKDYTVSGVTITWLASTGTAVDMDTSDVLNAVYLS
jgi:hypothetical protein